MQISININIIDQGEKWKVVDVAPSYLVSNFGNIRKVLKSGKQKNIKTRLDKDGYNIVGLSHNGIVKTYKVHRLVAQAFVEKENENQVLVDHINHVKTDNHYMNIRWATPGQNNQNRSKSLNTSSLYKGVSYSKQRNKWLAQITINGKNKHLGYFISEKAAARAYNAKAIEIFKKFAWLNNVSDDEEDESDEEINIYNS
jgi:hypothetical protein